MNHPSIPETRSHVTSEIHGFLALCRTVELDAVRGLAAISIVIYHLWFPKIFHGWTRVDLFFVLSGYLVTGLILRKSDSENFLLTFFLRRCLRIWPTYFLVLVSLVAYHTLIPNHSRLDGLPYYLTLTQNVQHYWGGEAPPFSANFFHTWSLSLECQFYLVWPLIVMRAGRRCLTLTAMALVVLPVVARAWGVSEYILPGR